MLENVQFKENVFPLIKTLFHIITPYESKHFELILIQKRQSTVLS